jgi:SOS-response transcriptional repressor LexA
MPGKARSSSIRVLESLVRRYIRDGVPPTLSQVARDAGLAGASSAKAAMKPLITAGAVKRVRRHYVPTDVLRLPPRCTPCNAAARPELDGGRVRWRCARCER